MLLLFNIIHVWQIEKDRLDYDWIRLDSIGFDDGFRISAVFASAPDELKSPELAGECPGDSVPQKDPGGSSSIRCTLLLKGQRWASSIQVPCFNMFQLVCPSRMASRTSNLVH